MEERWERVPGALARALLDAGWNDQVIGALISRREDGREILDQLMPDLRGEAYETSLDEIWALARGVEVRRKRTISALVQLAKQPRLDAGDRGGPSAGETYEALVSENVELARKVFETRRARLLQLDGAQPDKIEQMGS